MIKPGKEFLEASYYCDAFEPSVQSMAFSIVGEIQGDKAKAVKLFYWVRDNILYSVGNWNKKASETLRHRLGTCTNNANLLVAFLRAVGIPAGYRVLRVKGQEYFGPITPPSLRHRIGVNTIHAHAYVFLKV